MDLSSAIKSKSDRLNALDIKCQDNLVVTITSVDMVMVDKQKRIKLMLDRYDVPFYPCLTVTRGLQAAWGNESDNWINQSMQLYFDESVMYAGEKVGGIRVSHVTGINGKLMYQANIARGKRKLFSFNELKIESNQTAQSLPEYTLTKAQENEQQWRDSLESGKTKEQLKAAISSKYSLSKAVIDLIDNL